MSEQRMTHREFEDLKVADFERLEAENARLTQENAALSMALSQLREACLEDIGGKHEEIQCALCLRYWPIAGPPQHDATCVLAADRPAAAGAELLKAADRMADAFDQADQWLGVGPIIKSDRAEFDRDEREFKAALAAYRRARAGQHAAGPGREGK